ncbi:hypothetical protein NA56DRAFT_696322 [Hyaloscypha hepaticicola]|uniref:Uncharacterized protein n=1 Tax=Hyaloscypha hepaticicola TaxID=2082293 RepID=A0A2J6QQK4_9HELO|nr:hypothetical protein NA56DRAFT_696322 [Hyaloscypha hepaticicola]
MSSFTSCQSSSMAVFGRGGYNAPVDSGRGGYNAPVDAGRGGYNAPLKRGPDDDDEAEDGRGPAITSLLHPHFKDTWSQDPFSSISSERA